MRKPILAIQGQEGKWQYKYVYKAYAGHTELKFCTDLPYKVFEKFCDVGLSQEEIDKYERVYDLLYL